MTLLGNQSGCMSVQVWACAISKWPCESMCNRLSLSLSSSKWLTLNPSTSSYTDGLGKRWSACMQECVGVCAFVCVCVSVRVKSLISLQLVFTHGDCREWVNCSPIQTLTHFQSFPLSLSPWQKPMGDYRSHLLDESQ